MRFPVQAAAVLALSALLLPVTAPSLRAADAFTARLETALNGVDAGAIDALVDLTTLPDLAARLARFKQEFPDARWTVRRIDSDGPGRQILEVTVRGERRSDGLIYRLEGSQRLAVRLEADRLLAEELLAEQTLLHSGETSLPISLAIPDAVLTGSRYDVDVIVEEPLGQAVVAGGLLSLTPAQVQQQISPNLALEPLGGGGLFKMVQAPQRPGVQNWAAMLVHPDGLVTITKRVRVVSDRRELGR